MKTEEKPKSNKKKAILISLGVVATAVGGFFGFKYLKNRKKNNSFDDEESAPVTTTSSTQTSTSSNSSAGYKSTSSTTTTRKDSFPLKKGSKGERVKLFQEKLIAKYGKSILPKYGADGDFGSEMEAALEKLKLPTT